MTVQRAHEIAHDVKDKVRRELPAVHDVLVHIEPAGQKMEDRGQDSEVGTQNSEVRTLKSEVRR